MNKQIVISILTLVLLGVAGPALAGHPLNDPAAGYNIEALDQAHAADVAAHSGYAFAPRAALPTPGDFVADNLGYGVVSFTAPYRPWIQYSLKDPGRFTFDLQHMDGVWLTLGIGK